MSLETLRALALAYKPETFYSLCLDRDMQEQRIGLMQQITDAQAELTRLKDAEAEQGARPRQTVGEKPRTQTLAALIEQLTQDLEAFDEKARPMSMTIFFRRLPITPDGAQEGEETYEGILDRLSDDSGRVDTDKLCDALLALTYLRAVAADGSGDLDLTWPQVAATLGRGDVAMLRAMILGHHEAGAAIPFDPRTSGRPETA